MFGSDYLVVDDNLMCVDVHDKPDGRGKAFKYTSKGKTKLICPDCFDAIAKICMNVINSEKK